MKRFLFLLFAGTSCVSPYSISRMKPVASETTWSWGREFVAQTSDSVTVKIAFENNDRHSGVFNLEIINNSSRQVLIAPETFYAQLSGPNLPRNFARTQSARDPEHIFLRLEKQTARQDAEETNTVILHATSVLAETATNIASLTTKETEEERENRKFMQEEADYERQVDTYNLQVARLNLNEQKQFYHNTLLRKTTLPPNSIINGQAHFPRHPLATQYEIIIPVTNQPHKFNFSHSLVKP